MTKPKTLEQLRAEKERAETQLAQEQHKLERLENRKKFLEQGERKKRTHRLCNLGGTIESLAPEVKDLTRTEMTELMEHILSPCGITHSLGLLPYRTHHPNTLSGGQKQRVAVAVSMICGKELLVFDEPTSGLDFDSMEQVALLIQKLSAMGKVIFVVTHDYEFVCRTCSRVLHIDHGEQCDDFPLVPDNEENLKKLFSI